MDVNEIGFSVLFFVFLGIVLVTAYNDPIWTHPVPVATASADSELTQREVFWTCHYISEAATEETIRAADCAIGERSGPCDATVAKYMHDLYAKCLEDNGRWK